MRIPALSPRTTNVRGCCTLFIKAPIAPMWGPGLHRGSVAFVTLMISVQSSTGFQGLLLSGTHGPRATFSHFHDRDPLLKSSRPAARRLGTNLCSVRAIISPDATQHNGYLFAGVATVGAWGACYVGALATYKPWRYTHNTIGVLQALTAVPLILAVFSVLMRASREGGGLKVQAYRRLNVAVAGASVWR